MEFDIGNAIRLPGNRIHTLLVVGVPLLVLLFGSTVASAQEPGTAGSKNGPQQEESDGDEAAQSSPTGVSKLDLDVLLNPDVQSASLVAEPVSEAPAPVTVITSDMIEAIGARNLQEVLTAYVPGMTKVEDKNELNVAMRGVYTTSQQKILIMLNGHRLNSRVFSSAPPDFSIGIAPSKIKQIEVVRGPGSAVYGNLALNGVINIVTRDPDEIDGGDVSAGLGSYGQTTAKTTIGKQFAEDYSVLVWGGYFRSEGDTVDVPEDEQFNKTRDPNPTAYLMKFEDPPSFDVGTQLELGDITLMFDAREGKYAPPFTSGGVSGGRTYNYEEYRPWNRTKPGLRTTNTHSEGTYRKALSDNIHLESRLYFDTNETQQQLVIQPLNYQPDLDDPFRGQDQSILGWYEQTIGNKTQLTFDYDVGPVGNGNFVLGGQVDAMRMIDSYWLFGTQQELNVVRDSRNERVLPTGSETIYSGFGQLKHYLGYNEDIIVNLGLRYDNKDRFRGDNVSALSPRTALIFGPEAKLGLKLSYSESFVDAPYWFRYNTAPNFLGSPGLRPEEMTAFQLTPTLRLLDEKLRSSTNFYHARHTDIIFRKRETGPDEPLFANSGQLTLVGVEEELAYLDHDYRIRGNITYQQPIQSERYPVTGTDRGSAPFLYNEIHNVPKLFWNLIGSVKPLWFETDDVWLTLAGRYYAQQLSPVDIAITKFGGGRGGSAEVRARQPNNTVDPSLLLRSSIRWEEILGSGFHLQATVDNILNTQTYQGGTTAHPYRQPGRWFLLEGGYEFNL